MQPRSIGRTAQICRHAALHCRFRGRGAINVGEAAVLASSAARLGPFMAAQQIARAGDCRKSTGGKTKRRLARAVCLALTSLDRDQNGRSQRPARHVPVLLGRDAGGARGASGRRLSRRHLRRRRLQPRDPRGRRRPRARPRSRPGRRSRAGAAWPPQRPGSRCSRAASATWRLTSPRAGVQRLDGIVLDLGLSSDQLDDPARGFSFAADGPLDMRMSRQGLSAAELVNEADEATLATILDRYGEERAARRIAARDRRARAGARRSRGPASSPPWSPARSAVTAAGSIPRRAPSRRCASTSTTSWASWSARSPRPSACSRRRPAGGGRLPLARGSPGQAVPRRARR